MSRMLLAPNRYVQGAGAINEIGDYVTSMGANALVTDGKPALETSGEQLKESLHKKGITSYQEVFAGECSSKEIQRLISIATTNECEMVIAATDAPCSALSVIYTDDGVFDVILSCQRTLIAYWSTH